LDLVVLQCGDKTVQVDSALNAANARLHQQCPLQAYTLVDVSSSERPVYSTHEEKVNDSNTTSVAMNGDSEAASKTPTYTVQSEILERTHTFVPRGAATTVELHDPGHDHSPGRVENVGMYPRRQLKQALVSEEIT